VGEKRASGYFYRLDSSARNGKPGKVFRFNMGSSKRKAKPRRITQEKKWSKISSQEEFHLGPKGTNLPSGISRGGGLLMGSQEGLNGKNNNGGSKCKGEGPD